MRMDVRLFEIREARDKTMETGHGCALAIF